MGTSWVQDDAEIRRWFDEGRCHDWMSQEYERRYNIEVATSAWTELRTQRGINRGRVVRDERLIPWVVSDEHLSAYPLAMLHLEGRRRAGQLLDVSDGGRLDAWRTALAAEDLVVRYDPQEVAGFSYRKRRPGIDLDLIRESG